MESGGWILSNTAKFVTVLLGVVAFVAWYGGGSPIYIAEPIDARVVDAETGQPIKGAVVTANWQLVAGGLDGERARGQLEVMETVTDKEGRFHFDGFVKVNLRTFELRNEDPKLIVFKAGYEYAKSVNQYPGAGTKTPGLRRSAAANGKTISLRKRKAFALPAHMGGGLQFHSGLDIELSDLTRYAKNCEWKKIPLLIDAMDQEAKRLEEKYPGAYVGLVRVGDLPAGPRSWCGFWDALIREISQ